MKRIAFIVMFVVIILNLYSDLNEGLIANYPFNGSALDESGNGYNGDVYGATLTTDRFGNQDSAYDFNGTNDYIVLPNMGTHNSFSISLWFNLDEDWNQDSLGDMIIYEALGSDPDTYLALWNDNINNMGKLDFRQNPVYDLLSSTDSWSNGLWYHIVATYDSLSEVKKIYVNNVMENEVGNTTAHLTTTDYPRHALGAYVITFQNIIWYYDGKIDDVRIYNRTLSEEEITQLYTIGNWMNIPENLTISIDGNNKNLSWDAVTNATAYKVYSSDEPYIGFTEDLSGIFDGESWSTLLVNEKKFYYVKAVHVENRRVENQ